MITRYTLKVLSGLLFASAMTIPALAQNTQTKQSAGGSVSMRNSNLLAPKAGSDFLAQFPTGTVWSKQADIRALISALEGLEAHGLNSTDYHLEFLKASLATPDARDKIATDAWLAAAAHMLYGKLSPTSVEPNWTAARREVDLGGMLKTALETGSIAESLDALAPKQSDYKALNTELSRLRLEAAQPHTHVTTGPALKRGMQGVRVGLLRDRLVELGYLDSAAERSDLFDMAAEEAVKAFQNSSDLDDDGIVGAASVRALNLGVSKKIDQIRVNMERWRWLPEDLGRKHLRANIAGFNVTAWKDGVLERSHLTIVGKAYRQTPVFSDSVKYIELNPWWETPRSIATRDKLPAFKRDPSSVKHLGFQVLNASGQTVDSSTIDWANLSASNFPYRIRQAPGDQNALGQVKIMFPNRHNVYLHDTPTRGLFSQRQRAFSSGCLRTENPLDLTAWLLQDQPDWTRERIQTVVDGGRETRVNLVAPVPVHILYLTAVAEADGNVRFLDDIYDRDGKVLAGLNITSRAR